jgi:alkylation response protein AidB-like acyl-CoA dehydrogenase
LDAGHVRTVSTASPGPSELPVFEAGRLTGTSLLVSFSKVTGKALIEARQAVGSVLLAVDLSGPGVRHCKRESVESEYCLDDLEFDRVPAHPLGSSVGSASDGSAFLSQRLALLAAAEIAGACRSLVEMTQEYLLTRTQFGQVLGVNQALKHAIADNLVRVEAMTASIEYAAAALDAGEHDAAAATCAAKLYAGRAGKLVADSSLQMHGAIGYTSEYHLHLLMRRVYRLAASCGSGRIQSDMLFEMFKQGVPND